MSLNLEKSLVNKRTTYRHGDLYRELLAAAVELARSGGQEAIVLREVTRQAGVSPNAAYRHFADRNALVVAVGLAAQSALAIEIENEIQKISKNDNGLEMGRAMLSAVGIGYLKFAQSEPGLFELALSVHHDLSNRANPASAGQSGLTPFQLLVKATDMLVEANVLSKERRQYADIFAWSTVHGFAMLALKGPLRALDKTQKEVIGKQLVDLVLDGLAAYGSTETDKS